MSIKTISATGPQVRIVATIVAAIFAVGVPIAQALLPFGLSAAEFSAQGNSTLRAAGYAFSIWGPLYAGMFAFAGYQAWLGVRQSTATDIFGWPAVIAIAGCGLWILAAAFNLQWATAIIIILSAAVLASAVMRAQDSSGKAWWFAVLPLGLLAGWLAVASVINILTVLTMKGLITPTIAPAAGLLGIGVATAITAIIALRARSIAYPLPVIWGLIAVYVAEVDSKPDVAHVALGAAGLLVMVLAGLVTCRLMAKRRAAALL